jgi:hypothetical protein
VDAIFIAEYRPGMPVEVRTRYLSSWTAGFEVASVQGDRVGLRRQSDRVILPVTIGVDDIRPRRSAPDRRS